MLKVHHSRTVAAGDCDPQCIVNYPHYFQWFDRNCERLFKDAGLGFARMFKEFSIDGIPIIEATSRFSKPARIDDVLEVESWIDEWSSKTFTVRHEISLEGKVIAEGKEIRAWVVRDEDAPNGIRAAPVPEEVKERFN
ncbi:MAG: acyl-CoA thioesterase [Rhodospirillaceae bacterium]|jgi:YbgC/YbaW family acyl-CoA thioester hydrolase|nr:acyl-CoA thioesterase [Rhodospirillaceae bacterium]MBT4589569.1 acyl-CoA thioesterase [Rhodospirillaceae bacterium]MBT4939452.1 acyl-CoA thioesterase [Rhodospirillaceae bacterium]MBT5941028.1 acyl-CoA thioesterase [Rhodospirillaceae bacterium]MBT7265570.1 acyl-CoA thioesterase [Rhodospirillaceae bacterium]